MDKIKLSASAIKADIVIQLTEGEARAFHAMVGYGSKPFLDWFYKHCGKHYMQPWEKDLISLFETVRSELPPHLAKIDEARKVFNQWGKPKP